MARERQCAPNTDPIARPRGSRPSRRERMEDDGEGRRRAEKQPVSTGQRARGSATPRAGRAAGGSAPSQCPEARARAVVAAEPKGSTSPRSSTDGRGCRGSVGTELGRSLEPILVAVRRRNQHDQPVIGSNGDTMELGRLRRAPDRALHGRVEPQRLGREAENVVRIVDPCESWSHSSRSSAR